MIFAGIATIPGRERALQKAVASLVHQVDTVGVYLNGHEKVPEFLKRDKIEVITGDNSLGDAAKFWWFDQLKDGDVYLSCDDDLKYPDNYAWSASAALNDQDGIITYHGSIMKPGARFYYTGRKHVYQCTHDVSETKRVHVGGTGVMAIRKGSIDLPMSVFKLPNMADLWVAIQAINQDIPITVMEHKKDWIKYLKNEMMGKATIFDQAHMNDRAQSQLVRDVSWTKLSDGNGVSRHAG